MASSSSSSSSRTDRTDEPNHRLQRLPMAESSCGTCWHQWAVSTRTGPWAGAAPQCVWLAAAPTPDCGPWQAHRVNRRLIHRAIVELLVEDVDLGHIAPGVQHRYGGLSPGAACWGPSLGALKGEVGRRRGLDRTSGGGGAHPPGACAPAGAPVARLAQHGQSPVLHTEWSLWLQRLPALRVLRDGWKGRDRRGKGGSRWAQ